MNSQIYVTPDLLAVRAAAHPEQVAILDNAGTCSYADLHDATLRCASRIIRSVDPGQRVGILLPRGAEALAVFFGAQLAGAIPVFVSEQLRARQITHIASHAAFRLLFTNAHHGRLLRDVQLSTAEVVETDSIHEPPLSASPRILSGDVGTLIYTSGSTGAPKGVTLSHQNLVAGARIVADYLRLESTDRTLAVLPWSFDYGLNQVLATFAAGGTVVVQRSTFPPDVHRTLADAEVTGLAGVPPLWAMLTAPGSPFRTGPLPALRYVTNSGGVLEPATVERLTAINPGLEVYLMYGLTEAFRSTYLDPGQVLDRPLSIGKAIPDTEIMVVDPAGRACPPGVVGELVHRGPTVALGYWRDPVASAEVFRPNPLPKHDLATETVVYSGDYVRADDEGYLYYVGRRDELFKSRGVRVSPTQIESEMMASGMLSQVAVTALKQTGREPIVVATVVPRETGFRLAELVEYCDAELASHLRPARIMTTAKLPTTTSGKIARATIHEQVAAHLGETEGHR